MDEKVPVIEGSSGDSSEAEQPATDIFISYRHEDAPGRATALKQVLVEHFGAPHVFMDVAAIKPGTNFVKEIRDHIMRCDVVVAVIGPRWSSIMDERTKRRALEQSTDYVRIELDTALGRGAGARVLPVVVDGALMPSPEQLPRPIKKLGEINAAELRHGHWDADVRALIECIEDLVTSPPDAGDDSDVEGGPGTEERSETDDVAGFGAAPTTEPRALDDWIPVLREPDEGHFEKVARLVTRDNSGISFLGPGVNGVAEPATPTGSALRVRDELAAELAKEFPEVAGADLAEISQHVLVTMGRVELYKALRRMLTTNYPPGPVHRFLARLPALLQQSGHEHAFQLIATTNYDDALEQAFDEAEEPYDLAVYLAEGEHRGKFLHVPWGDEPQVVTVPNKYLGFPVEDEEITRTIIMKVHGAVDRTRPGEPWRENYVVTENDYIGYMSQSPIESFVPLQLLNKLRASHFLFLGYRVRDWNLRVFLQRVWGDQRLGAQSWSIAHRVDAIDRDFWNELIGAEAFDASLGHYVESLHGHLRNLERTRA